MTQCWIQFFFLFAQIQSFFLCSHRILSSLHICLSWVRLINVVCLHIIRLALRSTHSFDFGVCLRSIFVSHPEFHSCFDANYSIRLFWFSHWQFYQSIKLVFHSIFSLFFGALCMRNLQGRHIQTRTKNKHVCTQHNTIRRCRYFRNVQKVIKEQYTRRRRPKISQNENQSNFPNYLAVWMHHCCASLMILLHMNYYPLHSTLLNQLISHENCFSLIFDCDSIVRISDSTNDKCNVVVKRQFKQNGDQQLSLSLLYFFCLFPTIFYLASERGNCCNNWTFAMNSFSYFEHGSSRRGENVVQKTNLTFLISPRISPFNCSTDFPWWYFFMSRWIHNVWCIQREKPCIYSIFTIKTLLLQLLK